jgi:hypothetical protein
MSKSKTPQAEQERKRKISETMKKKGIKPITAGINPPWNKGLTKKDDVRIKGYWTNKKRDKDTIKKMSLNRKGKGGKRGSENPRWTGGDWFYWHRQARKIIENRLGRKLDRNEIVHHKDQNWKNNSIENLQVVTKSEHINIHRKELMQGKIKLKEATD